MRQLHREHAGVHEGKYARCVRNDGPPPSRTSADALAAYVLHDAADCP
jgi:hypothetical protein